MYGDRSWQVVRIRGTTVHTNLEATALILATGFFGSSMLEGVLIVASFAVGTGLHLGFHWLVATAYGKGIDRMVLTRAGRIDYAGAPPAFLEGIVRTAAGPTMNGILALLGYGLLATFDVPSWHPYAELVVRTFADCNLILTALNFLPAIPLDGGLILRAVLQRYYGRDAASRAAVRISFALMFAMGLLGLVIRQPILVYLAVTMSYDNYTKHRAGRSVPQATARTAQPAASNTRV